MKKIIERLSRQPREIKSQAAFVVALGVTALVGFVWLTTIPARFSSVALGVKESGAAENMAALAEAVQSEIPLTPAPPQKIPSQSEEMRAHLDSLVEKVQDIQSSSSSVAAARAMTNSKAGTPVRIEVVRSTTTTASTSEGAEKKPIRIETR